MAEKFIIKGNKPLQGEIEVMGSKNAAGPVLAAALLTKEACIIDNLPQIQDINNILNVLKSLGVEIENLGGRKIKIKAENVNAEKLDFESFSKTRMSVLLIGSLLLRSENFIFPSPGGDKIGLRPISLHTKVLNKLGANIEKKDNYYEVKRGDLKGKEIVLDEFSVTATEVLMMAASLTKGTTIIKGAAAEPHVKDLGIVLNEMGAKVHGHGTHDITIEGVEKLHGFEYLVSPDYLEAGTFIVAAALTPGDVIVKNVDHSHLDLFLAKLEEIGVNMERGENQIKVLHSPHLASTKVQALPHPGFPTDLLPIIIPLLIKAQGKTLIHDPLYENRLSYLHELKKMGADIEIVDPHRAFVFGPKRLIGTTVDSSDIRAGACLVVAGLMAEGTTTINNIFQIDRGYEKIEERLQKLGADIKRINS